MNRLVPVGKQRRTIGLPFQLMDFSRNWLAGGQSRYPTRGIAGSGTQHSDLKSRGQSRNPTRGIQTRNPACGPPPKTTIKGMAAENEEGVDQQFKALGLTVMTPEALGIGWTHCKTRTAPADIVTKAFKYDHGGLRFELQLRAKRFGEDRMFDRIRIPRGPDPEQCYLEWLTEIQEQKEGESAAQFAQRLRRSISSGSRAENAAVLNTVDAASSYVRDYRLAPLSVNTEEDPELELTGSTTVLWRGGVLAMIMRIFPNQRMQRDFERTAAGRQVLGVSFSGVIRFLHEVRSHERNEVKFYQPGPSGFFAVDRMY